MARGSDGETVLHKHLRVLDAFDARHPFLSLAEIAAIADLPVSTAHRLAGELEREGLLERREDRTYRLGLRLWEYASRTPGALGLRELARPWLEAVHARVRQHAQLGVLSGCDVLFIERLSTRDAVVNATLIGGRIPLPISSSGLVLLAHADEELVDEVIAAGWPRHTARTIRDGDELRERLRRVRADGFADCEGHIYAHSRGIAVPVRGPHGAVYAAMGVVVPTEGAPAAAILETLRVAAAGAGAALEDAYLPDGGAVRPLLTTSRASLAYLESRASV